MDQEFVGETKARLNSLESLAKTHGKKLHDLEMSDKEQTRLSTLVEVMVKQNDKQSNTLDKINENLTKLSEGYNVMASEQKQMGDRIGKLESSKVDWNEVFRSTPGKIVPSVIGGIILAALVFYFGLK